MFYARVLGRFGGEAPFSMVLPVSVQAYGVGFLGALLLWVENIKQVRREE